MPPHSDADATGTPMMKGVSIESERAAKDDAIKAIKQLDVERGN
jgi:hypothetical protein